METLDGRGDYEIGYRTVSHDGGELFDGVDGEFLVFTTHGDTVVDLPPGAERLAENDYGTQAFRRGRCFGVQFHPEYDLESAARVTRGKAFSERRIESALDGVTPANYEAAREAKLVFDNFLDCVRRLRAGRETVA